MSNGKSEGKSYLEREINLLHRAFIHGDWQDVIYFLWLERRRHEGNERERHPQPQIPEPRFIIDRQEPGGFLKVLSVKERNDGLEPSLFRVEGFGHHNTKVPVTSGVQLV